MVAALQNQGGVQFPLEPQKGNPQQKAHRFEADELAWAWTRARMLCRFGIGSGLVRRWYPAK